MSIHFSLGRFISVFQYALFARRTWIPFIVSIILLILYWLLSYNPFIHYIEKSKNDKLKAEILKFQNNLNEQTYIRNAGQFNFVNADSLSANLTNQYIQFQIYDKPSLKIDFWSKKSYVLPREVILKSLSETKYLFLNNHSFLIKSSEVKDKYIVSWFDIDGYVDKKFSNQVNFFDREFERKGYNILGYSLKSAESFYDIKGHFLFSIFRTNYSNDIWIFFSLIIVVLAIFFAVKSCYHFCKMVAKIYPLLASFVFFLLIYLARKIFLYFKLPSVFYTLKLFSPSLYFSEVTPSLGDLLIFVVSSQIIILFIKRNFKFDMGWFNRYYLGFIIHTIALIFLLGEAFSVNKIFERMVVESSIWFNFNYFPRLTIYSFIGLAIMLMTFSNYYLLSNFIIRKIVELRLSKLKISISFILLFLTIVYFTFFINLKFETKATFYILLVFLIISYIKYYINYRSRLFNILLFLFFATFTTTFLLYNNNNNKEQVILSSIASNIAFGKDKLLENNILKTLLCIQQRSKDFCNKNEIYSLVNIQEIDHLEYQRLLMSISDEIRSSSGLVIFSNDKVKLFLHNSENDKKYFAELNIENDKKYYVIFPRNYLNNIAISTKKAINDIIVRDDKINYALYMNDSLYESSGVFPYTQHFNFPLHLKIINQQALNSIFEHHIFRFSNNVKVVVTALESNSVSIITQFSYIFCFDLFLFLIFQILAYALNLNNSDTEIFRLKNLRSKIVFSIFLIVVSIFISITYLSYNSLKAKFNEYSRDVLLNNLEISQLSLKNILLSNTNHSIESIIAYLKDLSRNNSLIFKIYSHNGYLIYNSQDKSTADNFIELIEPTYFQKLKGQNSKIFEIKKNHFLFNQYEVISSFNLSNSTDAYFISISSIQSNTNWSDATKLIVVLLNLYIILFLISMAFAFWMANAITKPLKLLAEKISNIQLSKRNEYLDYQYEDEIGELVKRYNTMIDEIDESAKLLAFHEREEAWAEMAKQIAHEIRNPLTPMKLKIQYLQKKIKENADDVRDLTLNVSHTLIEQINNLENIASSFSNFAKLHNASIETQDWLIMIRNVASIFESNQTKIAIQSDIDIAYIDCDHNQMISCLNNLLKNAIQAHDDENARIDISLGENLQNYILKIQDYGKGISQDNFEKIFAPNFTTKSSGTGLGLAITRKIIESISGKIYFESELSKGTKFFISIPKSQAKLELKYTPVESLWIKKGFVHLHTGEINSRLVYANNKNVFRSTLYRDFDKVFLHEITYYKLLKAAELLKEKFPNYKLLVLDALRPHSVQQMMWDLYNDENKDLYIASPERDSMHNYGMAVDVLILKCFDTDFDENEVLDFGCLFDDFSEKAHFDYQELNGWQRANRDLLRTIMTQSGFIAYDNEFWHFESMDKNWVRENCERI